MQRDKDKWCREKWHPRATKLLLFLFSGLIIPVTVYTPHFLQHCDHSFCLKADQKMAININDVAIEHIFEQLFLVYSLSLFVLQVAVAGTFALLSPTLLVQL